MTGPSLAASVFVQTAYILAAYRAVGRLAARIEQPRVVTETVTGPPRTIVPRWVAVEPEQLAVHRMG